MKNILLLFCGGTISMHKNESTGALENAHTADQLFSLEPRIKQLANIEVKAIDNLDSTNMTREHWERLVKEVADNYEKYDGFLVTLGTNTMAYASSALSFALANLAKPVVLTGAQIPAESLSTDARNNLVNALRVACMDLPGVYLVFGSKIILGCRAKKVSESDLDAFKSFNQKDFGEIGIGIQLNAEVKKPTSAFSPKNGFNDNIVCLTLVPGLKSDYLVQLIDSGVKGLILRAYGSGDIPSSLLPALFHARDKKVPVVVTTQCPGGATLMGLNDVGLKALEAGVIQAFDMSMEAMTTKLMWLLNQKLSLEQIQERMETSLAGEINPRRGLIL